MKKSILYLIIAAIMIISLPIAAFAQVDVSLPEMVSGGDGDTVFIPITVGSLTGQDVESYEFTISYDATVINVYDYDIAGTLSEGSYIQVNTDVDGQISAAVTPGSNLEGSGVLGNLCVELLAKGETALTMSPFVFNEGTPAVSLTDGAVYVNYVMVSIPDIAGKINETTVLPVTITEPLNAEFASYDFTLKYDESVMKVTGHDVAGTLSESMLISGNAATGSYTVSAAQDANVTEAGVLLNLEVEYTGYGDSDIKFDPISFDEDNVGSKANTAKCSVSPIIITVDDLNGKLNDTLLLPIDIEDITGKEIEAYTFTMNYDETVMNVLAKETEGTLSDGMQVDVNDGDGTVTVAAAGSSVLTGEGTLLYLEIVMVGSGSSTVSFSAFDFNEGVPQANYSDTAIVSTNMVSVFLPEEVYYLGDTVLIPVEVEDIAGTESASYTFSFDYDVDYLEVLGVETENSLSDGWFTEPNLTAGTVVLSAAGSEAVVDDAGDLVYIEAVILKEGETALTWNSFIFNEGEPISSLTDGKLSIYKREMTISDAIVDADGDYVPDKLGREVIVTGIVTTPNFNSGADFSIQSGNSAIVVYAYSTPTAATIGDSVLVYGEIEQYRGKTEIGISDSTDVVVLSSGNALPEPVLLTSISGLDLEAYESRLVKFENVKVANADEWPETDNDGNLDLVIDGDTLTLRIDRDTDIDGWEDHPDQYTYFDLTCVIDQYTKNDPQNDGYQAKPGAISDFENLNTPPDVAGVVAASTTELQVRFTEDVNAVSADNFSVAGNAPSAVAMPQGNIAILTIAAIDTNTEYSVEVSGVSDLDGIEMPAAVTVPFKLVDLGEQNNKDIVIDTWEEELGNWWQPTGSGSTWGILAESSFEVSDEAAYEGSKSGKLNILNDPASDGWFVRLCNRTDMLEPDSKLYFYMKGADADVQVRFVIWDNGMGGDGYEASEWVDVTIKEDDWQTVCVDLAKDTFTGWITGTGEINSSSAVKIESIQIQTSKNIDATLYFDLLTERSLKPGAIEPNPEVPTTFALDQNYPNPFNPTTSIKYQLPENAQVKLVIYDVMGNVVRTLVNEKQSTGYQSVVWDARNDHGTRVSSGVYIYHMQANNYHQTRKMMLIK